MSTKIVLTFFVLVFLLSTACGTYFIIPVKADPKVIRVPEDFKTIQEAVNKADIGDEIQVSKPPPPAEAYIESVEVNKQVEIVAVEEGVTVKSKNGVSVFSVTADGVTIRNFGITGTPLGFGIYVDHCEDCVIEGNILWANEIGIGLFGSAGNTIKDNLISGGAVGIVLSDSSGNSIIKNEIRNHQQLRGSGIVLENSKQNVIGPDNFVHTNKNGIELNGKSSGNTVTRNVVKSNVEKNIVDKCGKNTIEDNRVESDTPYGIYLENTTDDVVLNNHVSGCTYGIYLNLSYNNRIEGNIITKNGYGLYLDQSNNNSISCNRLLINDYGIHLIDSSSNRIHHNDFIENTIQAYSWSPSSNIWDDGAEGNYWSDYKGVDLNGDGIGDTLLPAPDGEPSPESRVDYLPLMRLAHPVGGFAVPIDKPALATPYIDLPSTIVASTILVATAATAIYVKRVKRRKEKQ